MVNGTDSEVRCLGGRSPKSQDSYPGSPRPFGSPGHKCNSSQPYLSGRWAPGRGQNPESLRPGSTSAALSRI